MSIYKKYIKYRCFNCNNLKYVKTEIQFEIFRVFECSKCKSLYSNLVPNKKQLKFLYKSNVSLGKPSIFFSKSYLKNISIFLRETFVFPKILKRINFLKKKSVVLDYGSGDNHLANYFLNKSTLKIFTYDKYANNDNQNLKYLKKKKFDLIIIKQVIEHVPYPKKFLKDLKKNLKKNGYLYIETPNFYANNIYFNFFKEFYCQTTLGYHVNFFNKNNFMNICKEDYTIKNYYADELPVLGLSLINMIYKKNLNKFFDLINLSFFPIQKLVNYILNINTNMTFILKKK